MAVELSPIREENLELIMYWRMRPDITQYMNTDPILTLETQKIWLKKISHDSSCKYWLIKIDGISAGIINISDIDYQKKNCEWGYYIGENRLRSLKLAMNLELNLYDYVFDILRLNYLYSRTFELNKGVIKLHSACGSRINRILYDFVNKNGTFYNVVEMIITKDEWSEQKKNFNYEKINFDVF